ncbi:MAG: S-layer protein [Candidatus Aenigmatarchaeota archaeon]
MKVRKVLAGGLAAAAAGATLAFGALAASANLGAYVKVSDSTLSSPIIVVGTQTANIASEYPNDILGAADIAAAVAGYATTPVTVGGGVSVSVSDGVDLSTASTKIYLGDDLTKSGLKTTLTNANLPSLLAQGTFLDAAGTSYTYNQYINFGAGTVEFGTSNGDLADPVLYVNTGTSTANPLFTMSVVFNKLLNVSNNDVRGQTITLFGKTYSIGSTSEFSSSTQKLVLFGGGGASQTISEGQEADMTVGGVSHKVKVIGVSSSTQAVISVDGTSKEVTEGNTYTIAGVDVFVESVYYFGKETQISQVKLSLGASKITLENGAAVKVGQTEDTIDGTLVTLTGTADQGISKIDIAVTAKDTSEDSIQEGAAFTDPVFGAVKVAFGGLNKGVTDTITIDNSGTTAANLKFTDYRGNEKTIIWAYSGSSSFNPQLNDTATRAYRVIEGETVNKGDYVLMAPSQESEFGHIFQYTTASGLTSTSGAYIELKDVFSGDTVRVYLTDSSGTKTATFYVDGQQYYVKNASDTTYQKMMFTWGSGASAGNTGNAITAFPLIKAKGGEYVTLVKSATFTNGTYQLPGDTNNHLIGGYNTTEAAGRITYTFSGANPTVLIGINGVNLSAAPAVLIYEEKGKNAAGSEVQDAVIVTVADGSGSGVDMTISAPTLTAATTYSGTQQTDNSVTEYYDRYGVHVKYDTDGQGLVVITYPDEQATAMVAAGSDPKFSTSGTGGTYDAAVKIKNPVAKFDTEVSTTGLTSDLILIGGPCANSLVSTLLATESTTCSTDANGFINKYPNGMIKEFENAFGSGRKALVVAGVNGAQTRSLAAKVMQGTLSWQ